MTLLEQIEKEIRVLPPEKQAEVLDFITFLQQRAGVAPSGKRYSLKKHAAFGSWKHRNIDSVKYQQNLRAEWGN
jgi:hypothetical protein